MLLDIAAEALRSDGVLLSVHLLAANDRCAAQVRWNQPRAVAVPLSVCCTGRIDRRSNSRGAAFRLAATRAVRWPSCGAAADRVPGGM